MALSKFTTTSSLLVLSFFMGATANACQSTATAETTKTLTRVVQKDGQDDIEIRIENGTLTAKINGETIDASRVRKTDAGYDRCNCGRIQGRHHASRRRECGYR